MYYNLCAFYVMVRYIITSILLLFFEVCKIIFCILWKGFTDFAVGGNSFVGIRHFYFYDVRCRIR